MPRESSRLVWGRVRFFEGDTSLVRVVNRHEFGTFMDGGIEKLKQMIAEFKPCVVFIDPLDKFHGIEDRKILLDPVANKVMVPLHDLAIATGVGMIERRRSMASRSASFFSSLVSTLHLYPCCSVSHKRTGG